MKVRTTMRPDVEIEVDDAEYLDLQRQGLLVDQGEKTQAEQALETEMAHGVAPKSAVKESS